MSFETCLQFFKDACLYGKIGDDSQFHLKMKRIFSIFLFYLKGQHENLKTPSACLVTGRMVNAGTGKFDILTKLL